MNIVSSTIRQLLDERLLVCMEDAAVIVLLVASYGVVSGCLFYTCGK